MTSFYSILKPALLLSTVALLTGQTAKAQTVQLTMPGAVYTQNFDVLSNTAGSTTNNLTIPGWYLTESGGGARDNEQYAVDTGGSTTGDIYSYGAAASTDRALGDLQSGTLIPLIGAAFTNTTGATITSLEISYYGEEWRLGTAGRTDQLNFEYSTTATDLVTGTWTGVAALNFVTPDVATTGAKNGNAAADRALISSTITALSIPDGATFWIRWTDVNASGADDGLAVDDFSLTPQTSPVITVPEMDIQWNTVSIADGSAFPVTFNGTYFDNQSVCAGAMSHTYTILNTGNAALSLTGVPTVSLSGSGAADFTVTTLPSTTIAAGGSSTFVISYDPSVAGSSSAIVEIANNDFDENPYEFYILGTAVDATITASSQTNIACNGGNSGALSVTATGAGTLSYDWEPGTPTGDGTSAISGLTAGVYSITVTDQGGCQITANYLITEPNALTLMTTPTQTICYGQTAQIAAAGGGGTAAYTYTWSPALGSTGGPHTVSPTVNSTYTVTLSDANGCGPIQGTIDVIVTPSLSAGAMSVTVCDGDMVTLQPVITSAGNGGPYTYMWSNSATTQSISVSANAATSPNHYTVTVSDGCTIPDAIAVFTINVNALPTVLAVSNNSLLCTGETATLTASGADTYTWSTTETTTVIAVSPTVTTDYTVTGADVNGCMNNYVITQDVSTCTGITSIEQQVAIGVYPNPSNGEYTIDLPADAQVEITNQIGQVVYNKQLIQGKNQINITAYAEGIYFLKTWIDGKVNVTKIVKQ